MEEGRRGRSGIWVCLSEQIGASDGLGVVCWMCVGGGYTT